MLHPEYPNNLTVKISNRLKLQHGERILVSLDDGVTVIMFWGIRQF